MLPSVRILYSKISFKLFISDALQYSCYNIVPVDCILFYLT